MNDRELCNACLGAIEVFRDFCAAQHAGLDIAASEFDKILAEDFDHDRAFFAVLPERLLVQTYDRDGDRIVFEFQDAESQWQYRADFVLDNRDVPKIARIRSACSVCLGDAEDVLQCEFCDRIGYD